MSLCTLCSKIPAKLFSTGRNDQCHYLHQPHRQALIDSAQLGCLLCALLNHAVISYTGAYAEKWERKPDEAIQLLSSKFGWQTLCFAWKCAGIFRGSYIPDGWKNAPTIALGSEPLELLNQEARMIEHWTSICQIGHSSCKHNNRYVPSRLLELRHGESNFPRLILTSEYDLKDRRYLALSHCWGKSMPQSSRTTMANLEHHKKFIELPSLPQTFQDFIEIAEKLQISLVWIDSLCIIQDSKDDWQFEAAQMALVYSNAYLTIAASGSSDGTGGCRVDSQLRSFGPIDIDCVMPAIEGSTESDGISTRKFRLWSRDPYPVSQILTNDPLTSRAWTLQERELSPRVVHYSRDTIRWECRELSASLEFPWGDQLTFDAGRMFDGGYAARPTLIGEPRNYSKPLSDETKLRLCWMELVARYTKRRLTRQTDVLPAISGIAKSMAERTGDIYYCGLWKSYLAHCLAWESDWHIDRGLATHHRPEIYLGPSWSWAALQGPVQHAQGTWYNFNAAPSPKYMPKLLEVSIDTIPDSFGAVRSAYIRLEGKVTAVFSRQKRYAKGGEWQNSSPLFMPVAGGDERVGYIVRDIPLCDECSPEGKVELVILMCCLDNDPLQDGTVTTIALALQYTGQPNTVRRVGLAKGISADFWDRPLVKWGALTIV